MKLAAEVSQGNESVTVEVPTDLAEADDIIHVVGLVGGDRFAAFHRGTWDADVARAILYCNLVRELGGDPADPPFPFEEMDFSWGDLTPYMSPDPEMESALAELSEEA